MADVVYELMATLGLDSSGLQQGLDDAEDSISSSGILKKMGKVGGMVAAGVAAIGAGVVSLAKTTVTSGATYADTFLTMSAVTGMATDDLQTWAYAAELVDVSIDTITGSTSRLVRTMNSARNGTESAAAAFEMLGISVTSEDGTLRDANDVFLEVIDALGQIDSETERDAIAMELFGRSARDLNPLIRAGSGALAAYRQEAEEMGYILDENTLNALGRVDDAFQRFANMRTTIMNRLGVGMAPAIERVVNKLIEFAERVDWERIGEAIGRLLDSLADALIRFVDSGTLDKVIGFVNTFLVGSFRGRTQEGTPGYNATVAAGGEVTDYDAAVREYARLASALATAQAALDSGAIDYRAWDEETNEIWRAMATLTETWGDTLEEDAKSWGLDMTAGMGEGIWEGMDQYVQPALSAFAGLIASYLHHSEPDVGPLAHDSEWMPDMMAGFAQGIRDGAPGVRAALNDALDFAPGTPGIGLAAAGGGVHITINVDGGLDSGDTIAERISAELSALFGREAAAYA